MYTTQGTMRVRRHIDPQEIRRSVRIGSSDAGIRHQIKRPTHRTRVANGKCV